MAKHTTPIIVLPPLPLISEIVFAAWPSLLPSDKNFIGKGAELGCQGGGEGD